LNKQENEATLMDAEVSSKTCEVSKISIITVSYNSAKTIRETIQSVLSQDYPNIQYVIVDGASTDGTQDIVAEYGSRISVFVSERDNGLYDAMNKAIDLCEGEVIGILNSDDLYASNHIVTIVMDTFQQKKVESVYGDLFYFSNGNKNKALRYYRGETFRREKIRLGITPPHPTFFVRKTVYQRFGKFDTQYRYAADFDLMARFLYVHSISYAYIPLLMVKMRMGGISTGSFRRIVEINKEDFASLKKNGIRTNFLLFHVKYFYKVLGVKSIIGLLQKGN
jgi:glycosyltransferase involved in cell wall biosynthesis